MVFLLNAGYVKLGVQINRMNESKLEVAEVSVYITQLAIDDDYEMKIARQNKKTQYEKNIQENQLEFLKYARLSMLLMFDFMNVSIEEYCLIKQSKQFKIFFAQYCQFFRKYQDDFQVKSLLKSYHRPIIEIRQQQQFESYLNNQRFNNNLFEKSLIQDLALYQTDSLNYISQYNKPFSPIIEKIDPLCHILFQRIGLEFFEFVQLFIKRSQNSIKIQQIDFHNEYVLKTVFLSTHRMSQNISKDLIYIRQHSKLIRARVLITNVFKEFIDNKFLLLSDNNIKLYSQQKDAINNLYLIDYKVNSQGNNLSYIFIEYSETKKIEQRKQLQEIIKEKIKSQSENLVENKKDINDMFIFNKMILEEYETPKLMSSELKKHQKEALYWMLYREGRINDKKMKQKQRLSPLWQEYKLIGGESLYVNMFTGKVSKELVAVQEIKGGILADDMGLGKTLMALALILETLSSENQTLIVVPKSVLKQWEQEIIKHSKPNSLKVLVYYENKDRKNKQIDIKNYDIILTTNSILSIDYQIWSQINNIDIEQDGEVIQDGNLTERNDDNAIQQFSEQSNSESSSSDDDNIQSQSYINLLNQLLNQKRKKKSEIKQEIKQMYKKEKKQIQKKKVLSAEKLEKAKDHHNLFKQKYHRVILDEAHNIKSKQSLQSKSANALEADYRWCLTGTPMQNKHDDLFALIQFLKVETFSHYFWWNTYINKEENEEDQIRILSQILQPIILRRTKNSQRHDNQGNGLNQVEEEICWVELNEKEKILYKKLLAGSQDIFKHYTINNNKSYIHIFQIINKLKLACNNPQLALKEINLDKTPIEEIIDKINTFFQIKQQNTANMTDVYKKSLIENIRNGDIQECEICKSDQIDTFCLSSCGHLFCKNCFTQIINIQQLCPQCRTNLQIKDLIEIKVDETQFEDFKTLKYGLSSKLESLLKQTQIIQQQQEKVLIFTQSIDMIQLIENLFKDNGIITYRITGQMSVVNREKVIKQFKDSPDANALLLSLRATSTGLNLTMANNVFLVDPWWNPAIEDQAIGRADRIGQQNKVKVVRFLCRNTIEQSINLLHQKKKFQIKRTLNGETKKTQELQDFKFVLFHQQ
ncbi:unnamed protein product [Paramecium sonneborni]|uniref:Uncharacterized protein n=1 Tax=Paramecium sonneborni TaxID=65129 RepID=A0A8S1RIZ1_9CILI|nr:unnamed protein product [Paramecium sonneborni]